MSDSFLKRFDSSPFLLFVGLSLPTAVALFAIWSVHTYTVDDAYISFRYAQNLVEGHGLVYNIGERVEGYTNFLWTLLLAAGMKIGLAAEPFSKILGTGFALLTLVFVYALSQRITRDSRWPVIATWLVAGNMVFSGYATQGLETAMFTCLIVAGTLRFFVEEAEERSVFGSALVFALAGLTRPEAPMYLGMLMLLGVGGSDRVRLGLAGIFSARNITRGFIFALPLAVHYLWRYYYYGSWLPNTLLAKTGDSGQQLEAGIFYLRDYAQHEGLAAYLLIFAIVVALLKRQRELTALIGVSLTACLYVVLVGGDWMPLFRFMAPLVPLFAVIIDAVVRRGVGSTSRGIRYAAITTVLVVGAQMAVQWREDHQLLKAAEADWDRHAAGTARWFEQREQEYGLARVEGSIALGDIGEVGFVTGYHIFDLLGLVEPVIARMPGGYTRKTGPAFRDYFFAQQPRYAIIISHGLVCTNPSVANADALYHDPRFLLNYEVVERIWAGGKFLWCIYEDKTLQVHAD